MTIAASILILFGAYLAIGVLVAITFVTFGVHRVDASAEGSGPLFRAMIVPGCTALWPLILRRWRRAVRAEDVR